jgi:hypothetical protein
MSGASEPPDTEPQAMDFNDRVLSLAHLLNQREPIDDREREEIYRLRYSGYQNAKMVTPDTPEIFKDQFDDSVNGKTFGLYLNSNLTASIRIHVASCETPIAPALKVYSEILQPLLDGGNVIIDPTRHVVAAQYARRFPKLPYVTIRLAWAACEHYGADIVLATIPTHHRPFYRRIFGRGVEIAPRPYPGIAVPVVLLAWQYRQIKTDVNARYPFLQTDRLERASIFGSALVDPIENVSR